MSSFKPTAATVNIDVAGSSGRVALPALSDCVRIMNNGTATAWIVFGDSSVAAVLASSIPVGPGVTEVMEVPIGTTHVAAIAAGATGKIYFTAGIGF